MPPRLLSDKNVKGPDGKLGRSYGFVDTVHGANGAGSVWTENRFCNQYGKHCQLSIALLNSSPAVLTVNLSTAAMPSLHFGYSLMIGLTIMTIPLPPHQRRPAVRSRLLGRTLGFQLPSWSRLACLLVGFLYPFVILVAIIATANHFILDAVAGTVVCVLGWRFNGILLNLLPLEDYFLWLVRIHKPDPTAMDGIDYSDDN
jgi:hypothetical protein